MNSATEKEPIERIEWINADILRANDWNPNRVFSPELRLLELNILKHGWLQPILINSGVMIIDGFHRWRLSQDSPKIKERWGGKVPAVRINLEDDCAMALTVRINRAKGQHAAVFMHNLVARLIGEYCWTAERVALEIGATKKEVEALNTKGIFELRKVSEWAYSKAWYPGYK
jgi:ParB-like chromosome segregation protein Spo0J